jgi:hypothetical protein
MKMQTVIEAGREKIPVMAEVIKAAEAALEAHRAILQDFESVQTESGRQAIYERCLAELEKLEVALASVESTWTAFETVLLEYTRKSRRGKKKKAVDLPGQMFLFGSEESAPAPNEAANPEEPAGMTGELGPIGDAGAHVADKSADNPEGEAAGS